MQVAPKLELMLTALHIGQILNSYRWNHYLAGEITQVIDFIPWVRCASGNVCLITDSIRAVGEKEACGISKLQLGESSKPLLALEDKLKEAVVTDKVISIIVFVNYALDFDNHLQLSRHLSMSWRLMPDLGSTPLRPTLRTPPSPPPTSPPHPHPSSPLSQPQSSQFSRRHAA